MGGITLVAITLEEARDAVLSLLDDDGTRWEKGTGNTIDIAKPIDRAIKYSLFQAIRFYTHSGGQNLNVQCERTTDSNGQFTLGDSSVIDPLLVQSISIKSGNYYQEAVASSPDEVENKLRTPVTCRINYVTEPYVNGATGEICFLSLEQRQFPELEALFIQYAVKNCIPRDNEVNLALNESIFQAERAIQDVVNIPVATAFPRKGRSASLFRQYSWAFIKFDEQKAATPDAYKQQNVIQIHSPMLSFFDVVT